MQFFVSASAWKMFSLCILPLIAGIGVFHVTESITAFRIIMLLTIFVELFWIYSVCKFITQKYSNHITMPLTNLHVSLIYLLINSILFSLNIIPGEILYIFGLIGIVTNIYSVYFTARILVMAERERKVTFSDYIGTFILVYIFIFGVWWLQPRVNRLHHLNA
jgi:hypothetical protein